MSEEITNKDLLEAINAFSCKIDQRFEGIDQRFEGIDQRFEGIEREISWIKSQMVTKDYLDRKLWGVKEELVELIDKAIRRHELKMHAV